MLPGDIIARAADALKDIGNIRWTKPELYRWITDAQFRIATVVPASTAKTWSFTLIKGDTAPSTSGGGTRQVLPDASLRLLDVVCNVLPSDSVTLGRSIRRIDRRTLDEEAPNWHTSPKSAVIEHYVYDPDVDPKTFWVFPQPANDAQLVRLTTSERPAIVVADGTPLTVNEAYHECIIDYVIARAIGNDSEAGNNMARMQTHAQAFMAALGVEKSNDAAL